MREHYEKNTRRKFVGSACWWWLRWGLAQTGGQFCVRSFEDRNANALIDADESVLTRGVAVELLNQYNIVIASALLDNSPNSTDGIICFQQLPRGQYSVSSPVRTINRPRPA
ncbi:MAG UNVERIFIED_CONTAM: hypothetical protein LVT10_09825 [Anaerolineae bacterium]|jgi:threonine/homoserine/homoserine lactone efflux protein